jgi:hypothetical protein
VRRRNREVEKTILIKCYSTDKMKETEMGKACSTYEKGRREYRVLVGKPEA